MQRTKKAVSLLLSVLMVLSCLTCLASVTAFAEGGETPDVYIVAGSEAEIFGTGWDGTNEANTMTEDADGNYAKEYTVDKAYDSVQLKTVKNGAEWMYSSRPSRTAQSGSATRTATT